MAAMAAVPRRRKAIGHRRRIEDEPEDDGTEALDVADDNSMTDGSVTSDENGPANDSDTSNVDETSPISPALVRKSAANGGAAKPSKLGSSSTQAVVSDTDIMLNGLSISDHVGEVQEIEFQYANEPPPRVLATPVVVSSNAPSQPPKRETTHERQRREHDLYRQRRDEDPAFVPNRGAFFMHDHRGAGPSANGFRPFPRGGARGRGRGTLAGPFVQQYQ